MLKVSPLPGSLVAAERSSVVVVLPWIMLTIALSALGGGLAGVIAPPLARLMLLSLCPLLGFSLIGDGGERPAQLTAAAGLGGVAIGIAVAAGAAGPAVLLQGAIVASGAMVLAAVCLAQRQAARRLDAVRAEAAAARQRAAEAETIGLRLGGAAHDINNLLTVVSGSAEMLTLRSGLPPAALRDAERASRAVEKALVLGRELLAASRQQAALPTPVNLNGVLGELSPVLEQLLPDARLLLAGTPEPAVTSLPPGAAEQILCNLTANAGHAQASAVSVRLSVEEREVVIVVEDDGVGMDAETLRRAAQPFFTTRSERGGSGMGLYTVHRIAKQAGGSVRLDSKPGKGTRVCVRLPVLG